jgi:UDP-N-acetylglucosamine acyltransferase
LPRIHPTAIVDPSAALAEDVEIGPYSIVRGDVEIGAGTVVGPHVVVGARTRLGRRNRIFQFASIGEIAQDKKYGGEPTRTVIGDDNVFREYVTVNGGTAQDRGETTVGDGNWFLAYCHVAHDCIVGDETTWSNNAQVAGHVSVGDFVVMGAFSGVHQFCRVGAHAMLGAFAVVLQDVPPFTIVQGYPAQPKGTNNEGLRRRGFSADAILAVRRAYKAIYREGLSLEDARARIEAAARDEPTLRLLADFLAAPGRGIVR